MLLPLPDLMKDTFDDDSLVYKDDKTFYYSKNFSKNVLKDINNKSLQIYEGYYHFQSGYNSPKIYLLGRGTKSGKFKIKVENFHPYCYIKDNDGEYKSDRKSVV